MLSHLHIKNLGIIEEIDIDFKEGLNILSGETGAGKSLIINAINMILGSKVSKELIRKGFDRASAEALFFVDSDYIIDKLKEHEIDATEELVISRELADTGRSIVKVNGKMISMMELKKIGEYLIDLHGQYDSQSLLDPKKHIEFLDEIALSENGSLDEYMRLFEERKELKLKLSKFGGNPLERNRTIEFLNYQIDEINEANLRTNEIEALTEERKVLANAEKIMTAFSSAYSSLYEKNDNVCTNIQRAIRDLTSVADFNERYAEYLSRLESLSYEVEEVANDVRDEMSNIDINEDRLKEIEDRLDLIYKLKSKYGNSIDEILANRDKMQLELDELINSEELMLKTQKEIVDIEEKMFAIAEKISEKRSLAARELEQEIMKHLEDLEMPKTRFVIEIKRSKELKTNGVDEVEFLIASNAGEDLRPLAKIASGGETSRIMLALKTVLAKVDKVPTMIFDEIDTGISGKAGFAVADKLSNLGNEKQIICVTHLASIVAKGDNNLYIGKVSGLDRTVTQIKQLNEEEIINEIARITSGGNITEIAIAHAAELRAE